MHLRMAKVQIVGPKSLFLDVVSFLHRLGTLHVENVTREIRESEEDVSLLTPMAVDPALAEKKKKIEDALVKINGIVLTLKDTKPSKDKGKSIYKELYMKSVDELLQEVELIVGGVKTKATELYGKKNELQAQLSVYSKYEPILEKIQPLAKQINTTAGFESIALLIDKQSKAAIGELREELDNICKKQCNLVSADVDENNIGIIMIYNRIYSKAVHDFLLMERVNEIKLPDDLARDSFEMALNKIHDRKKNIPEELERINEELENLSANWHHRIIAVRNVLRDKDEEIKMIPQFGSTGHTFIITGWMPKKESERCKQALMDEFFGKAVLIELEVSHHELENAPVSLVNPSWAKPFEFFYSFVKKPKYGGVDPTSFMAIFFPIIYGMMVGDVGYGLVILWMASRFRKASKGDDIFAVFGGVLKLAAYGAIVWGIMYMEVFGSGLELLLEHYFGIHIFAHPIYILGISFPFNRMEFMKELLVLSIVMGILHIGAGLLFGVINGIRERNKPHMLEKLGTLIALVIGPTLLIIGLMADIGILKAVGGIGLFAGLIMAAMGGGIKGIVEILGAASNIFSYARIMAIGLAGVILGVVANEMGMKIGGAGGMGMKLVGVFMAMFLHAINIVVSAFSPSIHTLRLHLVECFTKFYEPAESEYKPFKKTGGE